MPSDTTPDALIVGAGPAGLMAAEALSTAGWHVTVVDAMPSVGRKFLMAGKSGLNLTKAEDFDRFLTAFAEDAPRLEPMLRAFGPAEVMAWAEGLGQPIFTGSTGRVFPKAMKASPLLRAWLQRLDSLGVSFRTRLRWTGWDGPAVTFESPDGPLTLKPRATLFAMGGGSWARLGSNGKWADIFAKDGHEVMAFQPSNAALTAPWSAPMATQFGKAVKAVALMAGQIRERGEFVITKSGLEGGGIYAMTRALRSGAALSLDLCPDLGEMEVAARLSRARGRMSLANHLRKTLKLDGVKRALLQEFARPLPVADPAALARLVKNLSIPFTGFAPLDGAISTAGGLSWQALDENLMLRARPGSYAAGEMIAWDAPTGGYLLTASMAMGRWAADAMIRASDAHT